MPSIRSKIKFILDRYHTPGATFSVEVNYDGFDKEGCPESFLYDLYICDKTYVYSYHYEYWFHKGDKNLDFAIVRIVPEDLFFAEYTGPVFTNQLDTVE